MKLLLYCTKAKPYLSLYEEGYGEEIKLLYGTTNDKTLLKQLGVGNSLNGKILIECDFEVEKIMPINVNEDDYDYGLYSGKDLLKESCLSNQDIYEYLQDYDGEIFNKGYAINIKNLHIFDEPRELSDYCLVKAPTRLMKFGLEGIDTPFIWFYILPVSPQEMCRIANKEQTSLVRKVVLKEMLRNE